MSETTPQSPAKPAELEDLEKEKLRIEIEKLKQPAWRNPAYLSLLTPLVIGGFSIYLGFKSEFFDIQSQRLELTKERLTQEQAELATSIAAQQALKAQLDQDVSAFEQQKADLEAELADLRKRYENAAIYASLDTLVESGRAFILDDRVQRLVADLRDPATQVQTELVIREYLDMDLGEELEGPLLYALTVGLDDEAAFGAFLAMARETNSFGFFSNTGGVHYWPATYQYDLIELVVDRIAAQSYNPSNAPRSMRWFRRLDEDQITLPTFSDQPGHARATAFLTKLALDGAAFKFDRQSAVSTLMILDPEASVRIAARVIQDPVMRDALSGGGGEYDLRHLQARLTHLGSEMKLPLSYDPPEPWDKFLQ